MHSCINTAAEGKGTRVKKRRRGGGRKGKKEKEKKEEREKPARPIRIRCLPIKRVAAIDFEGERAHIRERTNHVSLSLRRVLQEQKERSAGPRRHPRRPGFPCIWIKTLHISPRCKDT